MKATYDRILKERIIAVIRGISSGHMLSAVRALTEGGIVCVEVTFDPGDEEKSLDTLKSLAMLKQEFGAAITLGAGTVLTTQHVRDAAHAGATYIVSPGADQAVIAETKKLGLLSMPGAMTPTEILNAWEWGADIIKLFPASSLGTDYIRSIMGPIHHIPMFAVGGVDASNAQSYLAAGCAGVCAGGNLADKKRIEADDFEAIRTLAQAYRAALG